MSDPLPKRVKEDQTFLDCVCINTYILRVNFCPGLNEQFDQVIVPLPGRQMNGRVTQRPFASF